MQQHEVGSRVVKSTATLLQVPVKSIAADKLYADAIRGTKMLYPLLLPVFGP